VCCCMWRWVLPETNRSTMPELVVLARVLAGPPSLVAHCALSARPSSALWGLPSDLVAAVLLFLSWGCVFGRWARVCRSAHEHAGRLFPRRVVAHSRSGETKTWGRYLHSREQNRLLGYQLLRRVHVLEVEAEIPHWQAPRVARSCPSVRELGWRWSRELPFPCSYFCDVLVETQRDDAGVRDDPRHWSRVPPSPPTHFTFVDACDALVASSVGAAVLVQAPALERLRLLVNVAQDAFSLDDEAHPEFLRFRRYRGGAGVLGEVLPRLLARRVTPLRHVDVTVWLPRHPEHWRTEVHSVVNAVASLAKQVAPRGTLTGARLAAWREEGRLSERVATVCAQTLNLPNTTVVLDVLSPRERRDLSAATS